MAVVVLQPLGDNRSDDFGGVSAGVVVIVVVVVVIGGGGGGGNGGGGDRLVMKQFEIQK